MNIYSKFCVLTKQVAFFSSSEELDSFIFFPFLLSCRKRQNKQYSLQVRFGCFYLHFGILCFVCMAHASGKIFLGQFIRLLLSALCCCGCRQRQPYVLLRSIRMNIIRNVKTTPNHHTRSQIDNSDFEFAICPNVFSSRTNNHFENHIVFADMSAVSML